jgi:ferredoxin-NADP reductase
MQATGGKPPAEAQKSLKDAQKTQGMFLACCARPSADLTVRIPDGAGKRSPAVVRHVESIGRDGVRVRLECADGFSYFPGQFVNLSRGDLMRSYSLASLHPVPGICPGDTGLELHVRKVAGGRMSTWLHDEARPGDELELAGPHGDCFYVPGKPEQPMLLIGTGTGLAPLYAIVRDAIRHGHSGPIRLYHGAVEPAGLYLVQELNRLAEQHANFTYNRCVLRNAGGDEREGAIDQIVLADQKSLAGWRVFLCGDPTLVNGLKTKIFLAGANMKDINADACVMRTATT